MRKAILVVVLVAASFLGGAFVNGPGLQWAETRVLRSLGLNNGGEIASVDLKPADSSEASVDQLSSAKPGASAREAPRAPVPSLVTENESPPPDGHDRPSTAQSRPNLNSVNSDVPGLGVRPTTPSSMKHPVPLTKTPERQAAPEDPHVKQASASFRPVAAGDSEPGDRDPNAKPDILDTLAALLPSSSASRASESPDRSPAALPAAAVEKPVLNGSDNWAILERKMKSLGVSRYTIEGEPGERVMFSCLIPLAGRQAITQRFEAEGDDMVQAAQAALRRITLWRATQ